MCAWRRRRACRRSASAPRSSRSGCGSPASCTTCSPTPCPPSPCRRGSGCTSPRTGPRPPRRRWRRSGPPAGRRSTRCGPCSASSGATSTCRSHPARTSTPCGRSWRRRGAQAPGWSWRTACSRARAGRCSSRVYRVVQEALTNARRHAPGSAVSIVLERDDADVVASVRDRRPGAAAPPVLEGNGITGMRERAASLGGSLAVLRHDDGIEVGAAHPGAEASRRDPGAARRRPGAHPRRVRRPGRGRARHGGGGAGGDGAGGGRARAPRPGRTSC